MSRRRDLGAFLDEIDALGQKRSHLGARHRVAYGVGALAAFGEELGEVDTERDVVGRRIHRRAETRRQCIGRHSEQYRP